MSNTLDQPSSGLRDEESAIYQPKDSTMESSSLQPAQNDSRNRPGLLNLNRDAFKRLAPSNIFSPSRPHPSTPAASYQPVALSGPNPYSPDQQSISIMSTSASPSTAPSIGDQEKKEPSLPQRKRRRLPKFLVIGFVVVALLAILFFCIAAFALRVHSQTTSIVDLTYGRYQGTSLNNNVTQWLGMRYAAAPVGDLRFAAPQKPTNFDGVVIANKPGPGCQGVGPNLGSGNSEDCLFLDVFAPSDATPDSKHPVYFYVQGGGLQATTAHQNASGLIEASGNKLVVVSITYRSGALGFLASKELQKDGSLNIGFKDQRRAMEWTKEHISKFGGDPDHVTLGGQSAGAGSVLMHLVAYGGRDDKLFHSALMQSASVPPTRDIESSQFQYDHLVDRTSCKGSKDTLACLRKLSIEDLLKGAINEPFPDGAGGKPVFFYNGVVDDDMIPDIPFQLFADGKFIKVPIMLGVNSDEGTAFTPRTLKTGKESLNFIKNTYPAITDEIGAKISEMFEFNQTNPLPYWHHPSRAYGRTRYICPSIHVSDMMKSNGHTDIWNYRYNVLDPEANKNQRGVSHGSEGPAVWGPKYTGAPKSYYHENAPIVPIVQGYWTSFMKTYDPNTNRASGSKVWEKWDGKSQLLFETNDTRMNPLLEEHIKECEYLNGVAIEMLL